MENDQRERFTQIKSLVGQTFRLAALLAARRSLCQQSATFEEQHNGLLTLLDEVDQLATAHGYATDRWVGLA
jgi:hypothetical protein